MRHLYPSCKRKAKAQPTEFLSAYFTMLPLESEPGRTREPTPGGLWPAALQT